ncbi:MAG: nucleotide sugar dehydrogenase [Flavobacteriaceae bacterium]|nr:nucleotide sugar dehydrogenase [Flavobacteriaceae bacterium]
MNISIFGLGYVGCVSMGCLAKNGHNIIGVDVVQNKVDLINEGKPTIIEKDIDKIIKEEHSKGNISATTDSADAVKNTDVSFICVGTPSSENGQLNLKYVYKVAEDIGRALKNKDSFHVIAIRSTVFPGTNEEVSSIIESVSSKKKDLDFSVVSNPEFLREGSAVKDYYNPAVTVIGSTNEKALEVMTEIYEKIKVPIAKVGIAEAEIIKYINNSFHALKITFANEVGNICKKMGIDSHKVMELFCMDTKLNISPSYLKPGFAYGGSCLPKDLKGLSTIAHDKYLSVPVINSIEASNAYQKKIAFELVTAKNKNKIGILGLSFKSGTDDLRYSPAVELTESLMGKGYDLSIFDENVNLTKISGTNKDYIDKHIPHLSDLITDDLNKVVEKSEVLVITQNNPKFQEIAERYEDKFIIDLVRIQESYSTENVEGICW